MWNSDGRRLPDWVEDAYDHLAPRIVDSDGGLPRALFGRLAELAEYVDGDTIHETMDRCPSKVQ